jgi:hypothetical protein
MHGELCQKTGRKVSLGYIYRFLHRNRWRKLGPRPTHVKGNPETRETFKKNFPKR